MNYDEIFPIGQRVLVELVDASTTSASGLEVATGNSLQLPVMGRVVRPGDQSRFAAGDTLMFRRYAVDELKFDIEGDEVKVYLADDADVLAIIKKVESTTK